MWMSPKVSVLKTLALTSFSLCNASGVGCPNLLNLDVSNYQIKIFAPLSTENKNDSCPVIKVSFNSFSFLFTGDISFNAPPTWSLSACVKTK